MNIQPEIPRKNPKTRMVIGEDYPDLGQLEGQAVYSFSSSVSSSDLAGLFISSEEGQTMVNQFLEMYLHRLSSIYHISIQYDGPNLFVACEDRIASTVFFLHGDFVHNGRRAINNTIDEMQPQKFSLHQFILSGCHYCNMKS